MKKRKRSIFYRLILTISLVVFVQTGVIGLALLVSRVIPNLEDNAYEIFSQTVLNRRNYIESEMHNRWSVIDGFIPEFTASFTDSGIKNALPTEEQVLSFLSGSMPSLIAMLRDTGTTGAFIILNDHRNTDTHSCVYLKDSDPNFNDLQYNSDLLMLKGPPEFVKSYKIPLADMWNYAITLNDRNRDIFDKPYRAAQITKNPGLLGYWHISPALYDENEKVITYTKPLVDENGYTFGVIGVEIEQNFFYKMLPESELPGQNFSGYAIAVSSGEKSVTPAAVQSANLKRILPYGKDIQVSEANREYNGYDLKSVSPVPLSMYFEEIKLYNKNTPFSDTRWFLAGIAETPVLLRSVQQLQHTLILVVLFSFMFGICTSVFLGFSFTRPITQLTKSIRRIEPGCEVSLEEINITEIDELSATIEQLNRDVINSLLKTDKIISMVDLDIGSFEHRTGSPYVHISKALAGMFDLPLLDADSLNIEADTFEAILNDIKSRKTGENIYQYSQYPSKWLKIESLTSSAGEFGIVIDITADELSKQALMYERDYDLLTRIYNRYAFQREFLKRCMSELKGVSAFFMSDLDNLKYVNDTYGHDAGDLYIKKTAALLAVHLKDKRAVFGRMSGDEFYTFLYGYETEDEIRKIINDFYKTLASESITLPDGSKFKLKLSSGIAWYGKDSFDPNELIRFADFAMYQGKNTVKGGIREFDKALYQAGSYMIMGKEELYSIFDEQLIDYVFQPIVSARDGSVYGYEALMRPQGNTINNPEKLISLASSQGQLWRVEKITFYMVLELYKKHQDLFSNVKIFINSVPNQVLKDEEYEEIQNLYGDFLDKVVVEITESESISNVQLSKKKELIASWNSLLALDDYGSGYANDISLVMLKPDIIKIDRFLVDGVDTNDDKQAIISKTIAFAAERGILVLAEGVETRSQLETLIRLDVDLFQGFFISKPLPLPDYDPRPFCAVAEEVRTAQNLR